ncbi:MAG: histidinol-phosphate phosphatase family protein [Gemmatimonadetes bacterium]|nr:histidinol-phosphate phosphatase family protein [Gemmatimonadota bacterium]
MGAPAAVFLDRDGTIIVDRHYLGDPAGVELLPRAGEAVARLNAAGHPTFLVTNQSGIGRGYFTEPQYAAVHARLEALLAEHGGRLDGEYHCAEGPHPQGFGCRKPGIAMYERAAAEHGLPLAGAWFVGDRLRDVIPAERVDGHAVLVRSPESEWEEAEAISFIRVVPTLWDAVDVILAPPGGHRDD